MSDATIAPWRPADLAGLLALDEDDVLAGYRDGRAGEPEPGDNRSPSYRQGWRAAARDVGRLRPDARDARLTRIWLDFLASPNGRAWLARSDIPHVGELRHG